MDRLARTVADPSVDRTPGADAARTRTPDASKHPLFLILDHLVLVFAREKTSAHGRSWDSFHLQHRRRICHFRFELQRTGLFVRCAGTWRTMEGGCASSKQANTEDEEGPPT
jgi:hypothetical protein